MKPMNFPGRLNQRRINALEIVKKQNPYPRQQEDIEALEAKIVPQAVAVGILTKKKRAGTQRLR